MQFSKFDETKTIVWKFYHQLKFYQNTIYLTQHKRVSLQSLRFATLKIHISSAFRVPFSYLCRFAFSLNTCKWAVIQNFIQNITRSPRIVSLAIKKKQLNQRKHDKLHGNNERKMTSFKSTENTDPHISKQRSK